MRVAILDPFSGIAGDMTLGALVHVGLDPDWLRALPATLGLADVRVDIREVIRGEIVCQKVDFEIPPQPHGRHIREIRDLVAEAEHPRSCASVPTHVHRDRDGGGEIHGMPPEEVHLHEVGAVDAILDVVGVIWGFEQLGVERVYCGPIALGDGTVKAAHGLLPVPAPATLKLLEGHPVRPGPEGSGSWSRRLGPRLFARFRRARRRRNSCPAQRVRSRNKGLSRTRERSAHHSRRCRRTIDARGIWSSSSATSTT